MSDDLVLNVRQIQEYPLKGGASAGDGVLMQTGGLGGPYVYTTAAGLVTGAMAEDGPLGIGVLPPFDAAPSQLFVEDLVVPIDGGVMFNVYASLSGPRYWVSGPAATLTMNAQGSLQYQVAPPGPGGNPLPGVLDTAMVLSPIGYMFLADTLLVSRDPVLDLEVATKQYVDSGDQDIVNNSVWSFNGRRGDITLLLADVVGAGGAPINSPAFTGTPLAPTPPTSDNSTRIATTAFVNAAIAVEHQVILGLIAQAELDVLDQVGQTFAPINSPHFTGDPQAPTPAITDNDNSIATTAFVQSLGQLIINSLQGEMARIVVVSPTPPPMPTQGMLWWDSSKGAHGGGGSDIGGSLFIWYVDGGHGAWVDASPSEPGPPGPQGEVELHVGPYPPSDIDTGTMWFDSVVGLVEVWDGTAWQPAVPSFSATSRGTVPASGGGTTNFLRADGTWAVPPFPPVFSSTANGLVPSAGTAAINRVLNADGVWRNSIGRVVTTAPDGYVMQPGDGLIIITGPFGTAARTWTLPLANSVPVGSRIITIVENVGAGGLTVTTQGGNWFAYPRPGGAGATNGGITWPAGWASGEFISYSGGWLMVSNNVAFQADFSGSVPAPGTAALPNDVGNAFAILYRDAVWRVPEGPQVSIGSTYQMTARDRSLRLWQPGSPVTITLAPIAQVPWGTFITICINSNLTTVPEVTIAAASGEIIYQPNIGGGSPFLSSFSTTRRGVFQMIRHDGGWFMVNNFGFSTPLIWGSVPPVPAGTPATASLRADGTWS